MSKFKPAKRSYKFAKAQSESGQNGSGASGAISVDDAKKMLDESAKTNRTLFFGFNVLLAAAFLTVASVTDADLLVGRKLAKLPILSIDVPVYIFASIIPLLIVILHFDLLHNLNEHSRKLQKWAFLYEQKNHTTIKCAPEISALRRNLIYLNRLLFWLWFCRIAFLDIYSEKNETVENAIKWNQKPEFLYWITIVILWRPVTWLLFHLSNKKTESDPTSALTNKIYPFLHDFAWLYSHHKGPAETSTELMPNICWILYCYIPISLNAFILIHFAALQNYFLTAWHIILISFSIAWTLKFWRGLGNGWQEIRIALAGLGAICLGWTLALFALIQAHLDHDISPHLIHRAIDFEERFDIALLPRLHLANYQLELPTNNLQLAKILNPDKKTETELLFASGPHLNLAGRRLGFIDLTSAKLPLVDLTNTNFKGAYMPHAIFSGSIIFNTNLQGTHLQNVQFRSAHFSDVNLQGAYMPNAHLQGAFLDDSDLRGAYLARAELQGAIIWNSKLQGADFRQAKMQGARLYKSQWGGNYFEDTQMNNIGERDFEKWNSRDGSIDWSTVYDLKNDTETANYFVLDKQRQDYLTKIGDKGKAFKIPELAPAQPTLFIEQWKTVVCSNPTIARQALTRPNREIPRLITPQILEGMRKNSICAPFIDAAIANKNKHK